MAKTVTYVIAPNGERWGIWLDGFLLEEPGSEESARSSVKMRIEGIQDRGDVGRMVVAKEPPAKP
jgi:hypothetical protein